MNDDKNKEMMKELKKKNKQTLRKERDDLQNRQAFLRSKRDALWEKRDQFRQAMYLAAKEGKTEIEKLLSKQLDDIKEDLSGIDKEYASNSTSLECYSKIVKNRKEGDSSIIGTVFMGLGTGAAIWLGKASLDKAYVSDMEGTLKNKSVLEIFNRLNPLRMFSMRK